MGAPSKVARPKKCTFPPSWATSAAAATTSSSWFSPSVNTTTVRDASEFSSKPVQQVRMAEPTAVPWVATIPGLTEAKKSLTAATSVVRGHWT